LEKLTSHQIFMIKGMLKSNEWKIFKDFIKELIIYYLSTVENKDFLRGLKMTITKFEEEIERISL